jgi:2-amino-4-hydroxy-6-hydroxymethyldihydropteridine diphosphokinase
MRIVFGLGSNIGDREAYLSLATEELVGRLELINLKKSNIFKNPAMLLPNSPQEWNREFFNIAISADIDFKKFSALDVLRVAKDIEKALGRKPEEKWAPREIDIDILLIGDLKIKIDDILEIPHPGLKDREFFIKTVAEVV